MLQRNLCAVWFTLALCIVAGAQERSISGEYRNYAEGFAVRIPTGLRGVTGNQAGPERGVTIFLPAGGSVAVYGEPNSLEYKTAEEGIRDSLSKHCDSGKSVVSAALVGQVHGANGRVVCGERAIVEMLAFRPGGGPIYWLRLETRRIDPKLTKHCWRRLPEGSKSSTGIDSRVTVVASRAGTWSKLLLLVI